jgi:metal-sulfur cluster biosynthetic enzyme
MSDNNPIFDALSKVNDPELHRSITELGMVESIQRNGDSVELRRQYSQLKASRR